MKKLLTILVVFITTIGFYSCSENESFNESNIIGEWKCVQEEGWEVIGHKPNGEKEHWESKVGDEDWDDSYIVFYDNNTGLWEDDKFNWLFNDNKFNFTFDDTEYNENNFNVLSLTNKSLIIEVKYKDVFYNKLYFIKD